MTSTQHRSTQLPSHALGRPISGYTWASDRALAVLRIGYGLTFLWAFIDKAFGVGGAAWIEGNSPTKGFLTSSAEGPFSGLYTEIAGAWWADLLFMAGLLGIGVALTLGVAIRIAAATGALLYVLMWSVVLPPENHPFLDEHLLGAAALVVLALTYAGDTWGLGRNWARLFVVSQHPVLR